MTDDDDFVEEDEFGGRPRSSFDTEGNIVFICIIRDFYKMC
jgi:hypothetical protein